MHFAAVITFFLGYFILNALLQQLETLIMLEFIFWSFDAFLQLLKTLQTKRKLPVLPVLLYFTCENILFLRVLI